MSVLFGKLDSFIKELELCLLQVCQGAGMQCTFGLAPSSLVVLPVNRVLTDNVPDANIMDHKPVVNILPFGMCSSLANPTVASATSAALGVLTPMPCIPNTPSPWASGAPTVLLGNQPSLDNTHLLTCMWGGRDYLYDTRRVYCNDSLRAAFRAELKSRNLESRND